MQTIQSTILLDSLRILDIDILEPLFDIMIRKQEKCLGFSSRDSTCVWGSSCLITILSGQILLSINLKQGAYRCLELGTMAHHLQPRAEIQRIFTC